VFCALIFLFTDSCNIIIIFFYINFEHLSFAFFQISPDLIPMESFGKPICLLVVNIIVP